MIEKCIKCDATMPDERVHLGYRECVSCSEVEPYSAHVVYPHKTGAFVQPVSKETKKNFKTRVTLAGREINDYMLSYIIKELKNFLSRKKKSLRNTKIIIVGLTYKAGVADMRNSLNFEIFKMIKKYNKKVIGCDPFVVEKTKRL